MDSQLQQILVNIINAVPAWVGIIILVLVAVVWFCGIFAPDLPWESSLFKHKKLKNNKSRK